MLGIRELSYSVTPVVLHYTVVIRSAWDIQYCAFNTATYPGLPNALPQSKPNPYFRYRISLVNVANRIVRLSASVCYIRVMRGLLSSRYCVGVLAVATVTPGTAPLCAVVLQQQCDNAT